MKDIILSEKSIQFKDREGLIEAWLWMSNMMARARELKTKLEQYIIEHFKDNGIEAIEVEDFWILTVGNKKKEKFRTDKIYDLFGFTDIQRRILQSNPRFKKTELKLEFGNDDLSEVLDTKYEDILEVKEINTKILDQVKPKEKEKRDAKH